MTDEELEMHNKYVHALMTENAHLRDISMGLLGALTPSPETKAAYMGEFSVRLPDLGEDGNEVMRDINVPWTTIRDIMAAILKRSETLINKD